MCPRTRQSNIEMKILGILAGKLVIGFGAKLGSGSGITARWVGWGELRHHDLPCSGPSGTDGGDEELRWERWAP